MEIRTGSAVNSLHSLREQGYDAVFLALGAHRGMKMQIPGEDAPGVMECISLLREVSLGKK